MNYKFGEVELELAPSQAINDCGKTIDNIRRFLSVFFSMLKNMIFTFVLI